MQLLKMLMLIGMVGAFGVGCGKDEGKAKLRFANTQANSIVSHPNFLATTSAATEFRMKLIAAYLAENIDSTTGNNVGNTAMIYLNPDCADDIMHCDISAGTAEDGAAMSHIVTSFFNFGDTTTNVNTALNAQEREITPGTYRYARLEFCKYNSGNSANVQWDGGSAGGSQSFQRNSCTVNSAELSPAVEVTEGSTVTLTLSYDYSTAIQTGSDATGDSCVGSGATKTCFTLPTFTPSASQ